MRPTGSKKKPTKPGSVKGRYTIHSTHSAPPKEKAVMTYLSLDPGGKREDPNDPTFDIRLERRYATVDTCGNPTGKYCRFIESIAQNKHKLPFNREVLAKDVTKSNLVAAVVTLMDSYVEAAEGSPDIAVIERQMEANTSMIRLEMILITYFLLRHPSTCVIEVSSKLKGKNLGAPDLPRPKLKEWCGQTALRLAEKRGDQAFIAYIYAQLYDEYGRPRLKRDVKTDDDTDNLCQIEALCVELGYQTTDMGQVKREEICLVPTGIVLTAGRTRKSIAVKTPERRIISLPDSASDEDERR